MIEMFGAGTACVVSPIASVSYKGEMLHIPKTEQKYSISSKLRQTLTDIQYGHISHPWAVTIDT
jgi:branched-chain amino acid aminotransferase